MGDRRWEMAWHTEHGCVRGKGAPTAAAPNVATRSDSQNIHWDHEPLSSLGVTNHRRTILPLPAGEGWGENSPKRFSRIEPLNPEFHKILHNRMLQNQVHGEGESFGRGLSTGSWGGRIVRTKTSFGSRKASMICKLCIGTVNPLVAPLHAALDGAARRPYHIWRISWF